MFQLQDFLSFDKVTLVLQIFAGVGAFVFIRVLTKKIGNRFEKLQPNNLVLAWFVEIASDIRNLGRGLAFYALVALPSWLHWENVHGLLLVGLKSYLVLISCVFLIAFLNAWEAWRLSHINQEISPKDIQFAKTLYPILTNTGKYAIYTLGIVTMFSVWGVNVGAFLGAGAIVALVLGIGGNLLISDFLSGLLIIFERLYYADSEIEIIYADGKTIAGKVVKITWRITFIYETHTGAVVAVSNRLIDRVRIIKK
ncbi:mechanosensitive ion channel domain-containing protein [Chroococcidiopsis sp.]|uniref:mechanosensitive ion channel domain-containing protein n=1 Tax=Chroococcidiopsis sp. TaxID=3088168 RepID=UPI003F35878C